jgi:hypothetical protein
VAQRVERTEINADWVLQKLAEVHARVTQEIQPCLDRRGRQLRDPETGAALFKFDAPAANRALELIGKHVDIGAFEERIRLDGTLSLAERLMAARNRIRPRHEVIDVQAEPAPALPALQSEPTPEPEPTAWRFPRRGRKPGSFSTNGAARVVVKPNSCKRHPK